MKYGADVYKSGWTTIYLGELGGGLLAWCTCCIMLYCRTVKFHFAWLASSVFRRLLVAARYFTEHCNRSQFLQELFTSYDLLDLQFPGFLESLLGLLCYVQMTILLPQDIFRSGLFLWRHSCPYSYRQLNRPSLPSQKETSSSGISGYWTSS